MQRALTVVPPPPPEETPHPSRKSLRGLDWFIFFVADIQTGFGPFIAVYLTSQKWTQVDIGLVLSAGGLIALLGQMPGGALVDAARSERLVAGLALSAIAVAALTYASVPVFPRRARSRVPACCRKLRAWSLHRGDEPRPRRPCCDRRAAGTQRPLCRDR